MNTNLVGDTPAERAEIEANIQRLLEARARRLHPAVSLSERELDPILPTVSQRKRYPTRRRRTEVS